MRNAFEVTYGDRPKIVQIAVASDPENGELLYGLDQEGKVYTYFEASPARMFISYLKDRDGRPISGVYHGVNVYEYSAVWTYTIGRTAGWNPLADVLSTKVYHPEDPER